MVVFVILSVPLVNLWLHNTLCNWECGVGWEDERRMMNWKGFGKKKSGLGLINEYPSNIRKTSTIPEQSKISLRL